ncbi:hypothetical protein BGW37DRAFT_283321 [Umbelopsis sp. PMI_123]|nr:hypothetical protein BGW37DRAFT_283321 [Umbelopsis sp. PMI_123]
MLNGESGILAEEWHFDLDIPHIPALQLPYAVIKHICEYLPTQGDKQRACLIHPAWSPAAIDSLWEEPAFHTAAAFQGFYKIVHIKKRLALRVQSLNIIHNPNNFKADTIKRSSLPHHALKESTLAKPTVIMSLIRLCENVKSLQIYGWQIHAQHVDGLSHILPGLQHLTIIGDNEELMTLSSSFRNLLFRLTTLRLDGVRNINASFLDLLDRRSENLENLLLSVQNVGRNGFEILTYGKLPLRELVLTDCAPLKDFHVAEIARAFPQLRTLVLDGAIKLTGESLGHIFERCHEIEKLDIRVEPDYTKQSQPQTGNQHLKLYGKAGELRQLSLRGICLDTITVQSSLCGHPQLRALTLEASDILSDDDFRLICKSSQYLETIRLVDCSSLTGRGLTSIARTSEAKVIDVAMIRCGHISSQQIKQFCQGVIDRYQKSLVVSQGRGLTPSEYMNYGSTDPFTQEPVYSFDSDAIDLLAQTNHSYDSFNDGEHLISQRTYTLDRRQVAMVAEHLGIPSQQLRAAISKVLSISLNKKGLKYSSDVSKPLPQQQQQQQPPRLSSFAVQECESTPAINNNRISFKTNELNAFETREQPSSTPSHVSDWSPPSENRKSSPEIRKISIKPAEAFAAVPMVSPVEKTWKVPAARAAASPSPSPSPIPQTQLPDWNDSSKDRNGQKIVFKYQLVRDRSPSVTKETPAVIPSSRKEEKTTSNGGVHQTTDVIQLGGWGVASSPNWADSSSNDETGNGWDATAVDRMTWQPAQIINAPVAKGPKKKEIRLFLPATASNDGWGEPPTESVAWDDDKKQGFAHDIIQSQNQTVFWKLENGVWKKLSTGEHQSESELPEANTLEQGSRISAPGREYPYQTAPVTRYVLAGSSSAVDNDRSAIGAKEEEQPKNEYQLSDDDNEDTNFSDSDDGVTIRTSADDPYGRPKEEPSARKQYANIMDDDVTMDFSETTLSVHKSFGDSEKSPSHPGNPKWVNFDEWRKSQVASSIDHPEGTSDNHIAVDEGGWDDHAQQLPENNISQKWGSLYDDEPTSEAPPPVASYKLVDIIDNFNETMSMQSTHSRAASDVKWEGYDSNVGLYQSINENNPLQQGSPNKHEATVEYIKAQAESRQTARYDVIRQSETDLISAAGSYGQYESDESKYISNTWESLDSKNTDDDWISSSTSDAGYPVSGSAVSTKGGRRTRNRQRVSVRHPMRPEQMAGQWGSFPIDDVSVDDIAGEQPSVQNLINVDMNGTFADNRNGSQELQPMPHLTSSFINPESPEVDNECAYDLDNSFKSNAEETVSRITDVNAYMSKENETISSNQFEPTSNFESTATSAADAWITNSTDNTQNEKSSRNLFDDLMDESSNAFSPKLNTSSTDTSTVKAHEEVSPQSSSPMQNSTDSPSVSGRKSVVLSVQIETVTSGTQPLVITESDDPKAVIHEFCEKWDMMDYEDRISNVTLTHYKEKMAKRVLGRLSRRGSGSVKNTSSPSSSASVDNLL